MQYEIDSETVYSTLSGDGVHQSDEHLLQSGTRGSKVKQELTQTSSNPILTFMGLGDNPEEATEKGKKYESMNFEENESNAWKEHQLKRAKKEGSGFWTAARKSTVYKWILVVLIGAIIASLGMLVTYVTSALNVTKFKYMTLQMDANLQFWAYISFVVISVGFVSVAGLLCAFEPQAAGSGIPQVKAYLNGVNLHKTVRIRTLLAKVTGMVFSVASGKFKC